VTRTVALVREVSPLISECALTHLTRTPIDHTVAARQHHDYCLVLGELGARVEWIEPLPHHPDGVFVEDTAVVVDEIAVVARPGVESRAGETATTAAALGRYRTLTRLSDAARLEGGDVMQAGRTLYVGRSGRTNERGIAELAMALAPFGYAVRGVDLSGCLHLKTACTFVPPGFVVLNPAWVDPASFPGCEIVEVPRAEPHGANTLTVGNVTMVGSAFPGTAELLARRGCETRMVDLSELAKAEGALTCSSVIFAE
jgi:dimethylargininase